MECAREVNVHTLQVMWRHGHADESESLLLTCTSLHHCTAVPRRDRSSDFNTRTGSRTTMTNGINRLPCGYLYHSSHWIGESVSGLYHCGRHRGVRLFMFMSSTPTLHWTQISSGCSDGGYRQCRPVKLATCRVLSSIHAISIWLAACAGPACVQHAWARPDSHVLCCTCVYAILCVWYPVAWGSVTFWWQSCLCNGSTFYMSTRSGSPYNVMHSSSNKYL